MFESEIKFVEFLMNQFRVVMNNAELESVRKEMMMIRIMNNVWDVLMDVEKEINQGGN